MAALPFWTATGGFALLAALASLADRRRCHRADLDRVGWVPWPLVLIIALLGAAICAAFALRL